MLRVRREAGVDRQAIQNSGRRSDSFICNHSRIICETSDCYYRLLRWDSPPSGASYDWRWLSTNKPSTHNFVVWLLKKMSTMWVASCLKKSSEDKGCPVYSLCLRDVEWHCSQGVHKILEILCDFAQITQPWYSNDPYWVLKFWTNWAWNVLEFDVKEEVPDLFIRLLNSNIQRDLMICFSEKLGVFLCPESHGAENPAAGKQTRLVQPDASQLAAWCTDGMWRFLALSSHFSCYSMLCFICETLNIKKRTVVKWKIQHAFFFCSLQDGVR